MCGRPAGRADIVFHIVKLWLPIFLSEAGTLHGGRCEGKQLDEGSGFFFCLSSPEAFTSLPVFPLP